ncbi:cysteine hydrolase family protein [Marivita sp. S0852]|uniref:cysteine hydrolase family protein n=1 Tax=Marivita sp. S0852 TaxID=3373893 RepID=UPI0039824ECC
MKQISDKTVLIPIDLQVGFDDPDQPNRWNVEFDENCARLIGSWRESGRPIVHVKHDSEELGSPLRPDRPGNAYRAGLGPINDEIALGKRVNSAFIGTDLLDILADIGAEELVVFGLTTDMCVSTTARMSSNLGFQTTIVSDACDCFDLPGSVGVISARRSHEIHIATLAYEFCDVVTTYELIARLGND